jgi:iron-sulfur cluster repair protein YtfE (RIC family)
MHRAECFVPFSRQHHATLTLARHLRAVADGVPLPEAFARLLERQCAELPQHFADEEALLGPCLQASAAQYLERLAAEHAELRAALAALPKPPTAAPAAALGELGRRLEQHIRFEERELFPAAEKQLPKT